MIPRQIQIRRKILEIKSVRPDDNLISSYTDFLRYRDTLTSYRFNIRTFSNLVRLTVELWNSKQTINKPSLLTLISSYGGINHQKMEIDYETARHLFYLFRETNINAPPGYAHSTLERMRGSTNRALKGISLTNNEIIELIDNVDRSVHVLNRVLRYPKRAPAITKWASEVFMNDLYRERRPELIGWLLDEDEDYIIDTDIIVDDFEFLLNNDKEIVNEFKIAYAAFIFKTEEIQRSIEKRRDSLGITTWMDDFPSLGIEEPILKLKQRIYDNSIVVEGDSRITIPDLDNRKKDFYSRIDFYKRLTMLWGIAYSHNRNEIKLKLYKRYYTSELFHTAFRIGYKTNNIQFLEWLYDQCEGG